LLIVVNVHTTKTYLYRITQMLQYYASVINIVIKSTKNYCKSHSRSNICAHVMLRCERERVLSAIE